MEKYSNHIIVLDLDETLLTSDKNITPNTLNTLSNDEDGVAQFLNKTFEI